MNLHPTRASDYAALERLADRFGIMLVAASTIGEDRFACVVAPDLYRDDRAALAVVDFSDDNDQFEEAFVTPDWVTHEQALAAFVRETLAAR